MHAVEGILATLLILGYMYYATAPPLQQNSWSYTSSRQVAEAYLSAMSLTDISSLIVENRADVIEALNRHFLESSGITIKTENLIKPELSVGIVYNHTKDKVIYFNAAADTKSACDDKGWLTNTECITNASANNALGKSVILADTSDDGLKYNSVYIDLNGNGKHDSGEGPLLPNTFVCMDGSVECPSGELYYTGYIDHALNSKSAALWNGSKIINYVNNIRNITLNNRATVIKMYGADLERDLSKFDVLVIADEMDLSAYEIKLGDFLKQGKGIVEAANITSQNYKPVQWRIFGIDKKDGYNISVLPADGGMNVFFDKNNSLYKSAIPASGYYMSLPIRVKMSDDISGYDFTSFGDKYPSRFKAGVVRLGNYNASIAIYNSSGTYGSAHIDMPADKNYSTKIYYSKPNGTLTEGSIVALPDMGAPQRDYRNYTIKSIDPSGRYVEILPHKTGDANGYLAGGGNPANVVPVGEASYAEAEYYDRYYNITSYDINEDIDIALSGTGSANKKKGKINDHAPQIYAINITVDNSSLYVDYNNNDYPYDPGEGPFFEGDSIKSGPETYFIKKIKFNSNRIEFRLIGRDRVPHSIMNTVYSGKTVWMPAMKSGGDDEWNYLRAAIIWASDKKGKIGTLKGYKNTASIKKVLIASGDVYQPYVAEISIGYND